MFLSRLDHFSLNFLLCNHPCLFIDESVSTMHGQAPAVERESCDEQAQVFLGKQVSNAACFTLLTPSPTMHRDRRSYGQSQHVLLACVAYL